MLGGAGSPTPGARLGWSLGGGLLALTCVLGLVQSLRSQGALPPLVVFFESEIRETERAEDWARASEQQRIRSVIEAAPEGVALAVDYAIRAGRVDLERAALEALLELEPRAVRERARLGRRLYEAGEVEAGLAQLERATRQRGDDAGAVGLLVNLFEENGMRARALPYHRRLAELVPGSAAIRARTGLALAEAGASEEAAVHLEAASKLDPANDAVRSALAQLRARADAGHGAGAGERP